MLINLFGESDFASVKAALEKSGYEAAAYPFDEFVKTGGSPKAINILLMSAAVSLEKLTPDVRLDIVICDQSDSAVMRQAVRLGVRDLLFKPLNFKDLKEAITTIEQEKKKAAEAAAATQVQRGCEVSAFINAKGGAGASFIATNVAHHMAEMQQRVVTYLDLDLQFSSAASYLNVNPAHSLISALNAASDLDQVAIKGYLTEHRSSLHTLTAKKNELPLLEEVSSRRIDELLGTLKSINENVVIDLPRYLSLITVSVLENVDRVYIVLQQNLSHLGDAVKLVRVLRDELFVPETKLNFIINRHTTKLDITIEDIQSALKAREPLTVCNDYGLVTTSLNEAKPVYELGERSRISKDIARVARHVAGDATPEGSGFFKNLFKS